MNERNSPAEILSLVESIFRKLFDIREGESLRATLMMLYMFLVISSLMIVKPVVTSLFLSEFGAEQLPYVFILVAISVAATSAFYTKILKTVPLDQLISNSLKIVIAAFFLFWLFSFFHLLQRWTLYPFYILVAMFGVVAASQFWIFANLVFNPREAKRLFGFIGAGAIAGGIFGGYLTNFLAPVLGSENLIFVCMGLLWLCILISKKVWRESQKNHINTKLRQGEQIPQVTAPHPFRLIVNSRHLTLLASIVGIGVLVAKLVEYQFGAIASAQITDEDQLTAFFGFWFSNLNIASLLIQLLFTRRIVGVFGVGIALFVLPMGILVGALAVFFFPSLWSAVLIRASDGSLKQSINKAGLELMALPIPSEIKNQAKTFIDVFVDSMATGLGGVLLVVLTFGLGFSVQMISLIIILLILFWLYMVDKVRHEYIDLFRLRMEVDKAEKATPLIDLKRKSFWQGLNSVFNEGNEKQLLQTLKMVKEIRDDRLAPGLSKLLNHPSAAVKVEVLKNLYYYKNSNFSTMVENLVYDPDLNVKTEALHYLFNHQSYNNLAMLRAYLHHKDFGISGATLLCIAREARNNLMLKQAFNLSELIEGKLKHHSEKSSRQQNEQTKIFCAKAIGLAKLEELYPYLHILLNDHSVEVLKATILGAGQTRHTDFIPILMRYLASEELRAYARGALRHFGPPIIEHLLVYLNNPKEDMAIRLSIPRVIAGIGVQKSVTILMEYLESGDETFRYEAIKALNRMRLNFPGLMFNERAIEKKILEEAQLYTKTLSALYTQTRAKQPRAQHNAQPKDSVKEARAKLVAALEKRLDRNLERIFRLLGLKYPPDDIYNAYLGLNGKEPDLRLNAVEFLDNVLELNLKKIIVPIAETAVGESMAEEGLGQLGLKELSEFECLVMILTGTDHELITRALYLIGQLKDDSYIHFIGKLLNSKDPGVSKMANFALREMGVLEE